MAKNLKWPKMAKNGYFCIFWPKNCHELYTVHISKMVLLYINYMYYILIKNGAKMAKNGQNGQK